MSELPHEIRFDVENFLRKKFGNNAKIKSFSLSGGGCINHGGKLTTSVGSFFIKWNDPHKFPAMFTAEAKGLQLLSSTKAIRIPDVITVGESGQYQFIMLMFIESRDQVNDFWKILGEQLAALHRNGAERFGLDHNNYMGSLPQCNDTASSWIEFFIHQRLEVQLKLAFDSRMIEKNLLLDFDSLYRQLPSILIEEQPTLIHGDLWSGNLIKDEKGFSCLIDPAVYYGNREVDLAMTRLFGGFDHRFYDAYQEVFSTEPGLDQRLDIYNLYPLLVHVNLFGRSYLGQVKSILHRYK